MKQTFQIFTQPNYEEFCSFINCLSRHKRKHHVTPWSSADGTETGFVVWYHE